MRKMLKLFLTLFLLYFMIQIGFYFFGKGHTITYTLKSGDKTVTINEILTVNKEYSDGYYFDISYDDVSIPFKVFKTSLKQKRVITSVDILEGDKYSCVNIYFKGKNITDIKCINNGIIYDYSRLRGSDNKLDNLVSNTTYDYKLYTSDEGNNSKDNITYYMNNYAGKQNILVSDYKGVYIFGSNVTNGARFIQYYNNDHYTKELETMVDQYYVVADYNSSHEFYKFDVVNIRTGANYSIDFSNAISFNSFFQGSYDGELYLIDIENKVQYEIDPKAKNVTIVGNQNRGAIVYTADGWVTKNINEVISSREKFYDGTVDNLDGNPYNGVKLIGNKDGIYYVYIHNGSKYDVYMVYSQDKEHKKNYIFSTTDINSIKYVDEFVYYVDGELLKVYGPAFGNRSIIKYSSKYYAKLSYFVY